MSSVLDPLLEQYASRIATRRVVITRQLLAQLPSLFCDSFGDREALLVADRNTWAAAGAAAAESLQAAGFSLGMRILEPRAGQTKVHPDETQVEQVVDGLRESRRPALAVGAGTLNDIVKAASYRLDRPYAVLATAPSMNGWTSAIAAIVVDGLKTTQPTRGPVLVVADPDILCAAPATMIGAGFADMTAKWVASADWRLADCLFGSGHDPQVEQVSKRAIELLDGREEAIAARDPVAIERLMEALCISGLSMAIAGSSAHISGAEHLFSHYIDMMLPDVAERELHGRQVGIGTLCAAAFYEQLFDWSPESLNRQAVAAARPTWPSRRAEIEGHFAKLAPVVIEQAEQLDADEQEWQARLDRLAAAWPELKTTLRAAVAPRAAIELRLCKAGAPTHFSDLGLACGQMREILTWARDIRARYTVLHAAADLGRLHAWIDRAIAAFPQR